MDCLRLEHCSPGFTHIPYLWLNLAYLDARRGMATIPIGEAQRRVESASLVGELLPCEGEVVSLDDGVLDAFPVPGTTLIKAVRFGKSTANVTLRLDAQLPNQESATYFLKLYTGQHARSQCGGEHAALSARNTANPGFAPLVHATGTVVHGGSLCWFLLEDFINIETQPADARRLANEVAKVHRNSRSPTGQFGFHVKTWHGNVDQHVDQWQDSWATVYRQHLAHIMQMARQLIFRSNYQRLCELILSKVVPRLLLPLQEHDRALKPSLVHGDLWDGNTAVDDSNIRVFHACGFYGHNEYDTGNWRAPRHRLSEPEYIEYYKEHIPPSEPAEDWAARQLLYSLCFNLGNVVNVPGSKQGEVVCEDMATLCRMFCPGELDTEVLEKILQERASEGEEPRPLAVNNTTG